MREKQSLQPANWRGDLLSLIAGGLLPLAFAPIEYYPLSVLSLALLFACWYQQTPKRAAWRGWLFGLGMFGVGVSWVFVAIHVFGQSGLILSTCLTFLFVAFLASYLAVLGWLLAKLGRQSTSFSSLVLLMPVAWLGFEWFKGWFLTGFPWLDLGVSQIEGPLAGFVPVLGTSGVSLLVAFCAGLLTYCYLNKKWSSLTIILLIWLAGFGLNRINWTQAVDGPLKVTMIQGNIPQEIKWDPKQLLNTMNLYKSLSEQHWDSDFIVWPENAIPAFYHQIKAFYLEPLQDEAQAAKTDIMLGLPVMDGGQNTYYNSMLVLGQQPGFYHKRHLVPFGDYVPLEWLRGLIAFFNLPMSAFAPGPENQALLNVAGQPVATTVCYEDVFSDEVLQALPAATMLVNATNNAWYGDSFAPHQHLQISRSRALETGRPLVRVTTNGISAFVDEKGKIQQQTPQFEQAVVTHDVQPMSGSTPYVRWHHLPVILIALFMLAWWAYHRPKISN